MKEVSAAPASPLERAIRLPHATAMVVGTIIGASIFVQPSEVTGQVPSLSGAAIVWLCAGALTLAGALVTAEWASTFPESGGVYAYLREAYGPMLGFLWGWAMFWTMHSGIIAVIAMVFAFYAAFLFPLGDVGSRVAALTVIWLLTWVNYRGVRQASNLQTAFTLVKVLAIVLMVIVGFALGSPAESSSQGPAGLLGGGGSSGFLTAMVAALFAFGGWHMVTYNAEETVDPQRTIPRALGIGIVVVTVCYIALNAVYFYVLPIETVVASTRIAADGADAVLGFGGGATMAGLVMFSTFGALAGIILSGPRVYYAMARDGHLFDWVGGLHPSRLTPHRAILLQAVWCSVLVLTGTYRELFTRVVYTEWIFFGLMALGLLRIRRRTEVARQYSCWGYPVVPIVFALAAFAIAGHAAVTSPSESVQGLGLVLLGVPVFLVWSRTRPSNPSPRESSA